MALQSFSLNPEKIPDLIKEDWLGSLLFLGNYVYCEQSDSDLGYLLFGGMLLGDTFHTIPLLNWLTGERRRSKIIWYAGTYAKSAVEFLKNFYPIESRYFPDGVPAERDDRLVFIKNYLPQFSKALNNVKWELVPFDSKTSRTYSLRNPERLNASPGNFIVIHPASRHSWKNVTAIQTTDWTRFGLPVITVGAPGEPLIPGSYDFRGRSFIEVAQALASARLIVAIHSSISCLSFYCNRPLIVCAPSEDQAYVRFGELKPEIIDLVQPTPGELADAVQRCLGGSSLPQGCFSEAGDARGHLEGPASLLAAIKDVPVSCSPARSRIVSQIAKIGSQINSSYRRARCSLGLRTRIQQLLRKTKNY